MAQQLRLLTNLTKRAEFASHWRSLSRLSTALPEANVTVSNDGTTIVCWHPEQHFPYQHSRPIPESREELRERDSHLKLEYRIDGQNLYRDNPNVEELQMMTFTPKHIWFRKSKKPRPQPTHPRPGI